MSKTAVCKAKLLTPCGLRSIIQLWLAKDPERESNGVESYVKSNIYEKNQMGLQQSRLSYTVEEYLTFERESDERHEYLDGQIYAMAGESSEHSTICVNLIIAFGSRLRGKPCQVFSPNMKVRTKPTGLYAYPDVAIVCGQPIFHDDRRDVLMNPQAILEVLSPSTEAYDRGEKFIQYQQIGSLQSYLLVSQDTPRIEHFIRKDNGQWLYSVKTELSHLLDIASIGCRIPLAEIYDRLTFPSHPGVLESPGFPPQPDSR